MGYDLCGETEQGGRRPFGNTRIRTGSGERAEEAAELLMEEAGAGPGSKVLSTSLEHHQQVCTRAHQCTHMHIYAPTTHAHTLIHAHIDTHGHTCAHTYTHLSAHTCMPVHTLTHAHPTLTHTPVHTPMHTDTWTHGHLHTSTPAHTPTHVYS